MKFLHISDLHIGKRVNEFSMIEDQKYILEKIKDIAFDEKVDAVFIAGDIYDKTVPPIEAVGLFDSFVTGLTKRGIKIYAISGNHDSAQRVSFGAGLMRSDGFYISQAYGGNVEKESFKDNFGNVNIYMLPFIRPSDVRRFFDEKEITDYNSAVRTVIESIDVNLSERNIIIAHQFVTGAIKSESEEVFAGGLDNVDSDVFKCFDYAALGHIHRPQNMGKNIRYCGTPLKYSFSEAGQQKSATVVDMLEKGDIRFKTINLEPLRDMREIKGTYDFLTDRKNYKDTNVNDYIHATLTDENDIVDAITRLRSIYPNIMRLDYDNSRTQGAGDLSQIHANTSKTPIELFQELFELQNTMEMTEEQKKLAEDTLNEAMEELL